ncbi:ATP-binding protein [Phytohabitans rumicis]|uniref:AAA+ ATPase domain-containing protein n=1 Tax=Phytohabitans rumicis TaxID=1076125 RepID=A0A6V8L9K7_9ACTN|nr:ATP-binding protein [Phytohabitans rumicis]GFJ92994.1 hypothetical protein Prum_066360 [Phytohabitans rumicis]
MFPTAHEDAIAISGIPEDVPERVAAVARSRLHNAYREIAQMSRSAPVVSVGPVSVLRTSVRKNDRARSGDEDVSTAERAGRYQAVPPRFRFDQLVLPDPLNESLLTAAEAIRLRGKIYDEWGLRTIEPSPSTALNLHGPPGTGKTLAAHAIADRLGLNVIVAGYAELESKFHGDGPKNIKAAFHAAEQQRALLLVDEADSLLSRRLTNVTQGSEQAINSMRSQIVLCLDAFAGVVVFSTNLVENYDRAFESRVRHFHFPLPDQATRLQIWRKLLVPALPLAPDVAVEALTAATEDFSGRDVKLVIVAAAERAALAGKGALDIADFLTSIEQVSSARITPPAPQSRPATPEERAAIEEQLNKAS